jgi:hypothetical protein
VVGRRRRGSAFDLPQYVAVDAEEHQENVNTTERFYIKTASAAAVDAMNTKKLEEKISGTAVV